MMQRFTAHQWVIISFTLAYVLAFSAYYVTVRNHEFLWYIFVLVAFFVLIGATIQHSRFSPLVLWGLSLWGLLHMAGGGIPVGDTVLYGVQLIDIVADGEFTILKFDQFVHAFGFAVATIVMYELLMPRWRVGASRALLYMIAAVAGMGWGALNELVEFTAVLALADTGVGGYTNTGLDLMANAVGAVVAVGILALRDRRRAQLTTEHDRDGAIEHTQAL